MKENSRNKEGKFTYSTGENNSISSKTDDDREKNQQRADLLYPTMNDSKNIISSEIKKHLGLGISKFDKDFSSLIKTIAKIISDLRENSDKERNIKEKVIQRNTVKKILKKTKKLMRRVENLVDKILIRLHTKL